MNLDPILVLMGLLTGVLSGLLGIGGGLALIPMLAARGFLMREAAGISLVYVCVTSLSSAWQHWKQGTMKANLVLALAAGGVLTVSLGSFVASRLPDLALSRIYSAVVLSVLLAYGRRSGRAAANPSPESEPVRWAPAFGIGAAVGVVSGLLGVGGGWLIVPMLVLFGKLSLPLAIGSSSLGMFLPALSGAFTHWTLGHMRLMDAFPLSLGGMIGARLGAGLMVRVSETWLDRLLRLLLVSGALYMLVRG